MARRRFEEPSRETSIRPDRVGSLVSRILQERLVRGFADPRIRGLVSIVGVEVSSDLRTARVRVSVLPDRYGSRTIAGLKSLSGMLRRHVRDETSLRRVPELEFRLDDSLKQAAALDDAIRTGLGENGPPSEAPGITATTNQTEPGAPEGADQNEDSS